MDYDESYYRANAQDGDRPALLMYERFWRRYLGNGPVLEYGCGVGYFAKRLARHTKVFGLEANPFAISRIQEIAPEVEVLTTTSSLSDHSVASVVALHVFEHILDADLAIIGDELRRILRPGGRILAVMPDLHGQGHTLKAAHWSAFKDSTHINLKAGEVWRRMFEEQWEFAVVKSFSDGYYDFPYGSWCGDAFRAGRTLAQFVLARPLLNRGDGENVVFILEKQS